MTEQPIEQRIAEVLKHEHRFIPVNHSSIGSEDHCGCGFRPRGWQAWCDHVATVVVASLGLTQLDVRKVAKAIWDADDMAAKPDFAWGETTAAAYRRMAEAALSAVGLGGTQSP